MAQFKSLNVLGNVSVLGSVVANNVELNTLKVNSEIVLKSGKSIKDSNGNYFIQDGGTMMVFGDPAVPSLFRGVRYIGAPSSSNSETYTTGTNGQVLTSNGESVYWGDLNLTQDEATPSAAGLMSAADKTKLDGIQTSADAVSFTSKLTSGTEIGTITINGTATKIYCEKGGAVGEFLPLSGGTVSGSITTSGDLITKQYIKINAWTGYGSGSADFWYDGNNKFVEIQNATDLKLAGSSVATQSWVTSNYQSKDKITVTDTTPTSATKYFPVYTYEQTGSATARVNKDLYYYDSGTWSSFNIGGNANMGILTLHYGNSSTDYMADIKPENVFTANRSILIPDKSGTLALTSDLGNYMKLTDNQTVKGSKTFSDGITIGSAGGLTIEGVLQIKNGINALSSSTSTTYSKGTAGQVLKTDGTNVYWASDSNTLTSAASGNTSNKIFLIGRTSQSNSGGTTFSHDTVYVDTSGRICGTAGVYTNKLVVPTTSGGSTYGVGSAGQVLTSNGTTSYWATPSSGGSTIYAHRIYLEDTTATNFAEFVLYSSSSEKIDTFAKLYNVLSAQGGHPTIAAVCYVEGSDINEVGDRWHPCAVSCSSTGASITFASGDFLNVAYVGDTVKPI